TRRIKSLSDITKLPGLCASVAKVSAWACTFVKNWSRCTADKSGSTVSAVKARLCPSRCRCFRPISNLPPRSSTVICDEDENGKEPELMTNKSILIVDDDRDFLVALRARLEGHGYHVLTAIDVLGALDAVETQTPDLIILDIRLFVCNGI